MAQSYLEKTRRHKREAIYSCVAILRRIATFETHQQNPFNKIVTPRKLGPPPAVAFCSTRNAPLIKMELVRREKGLKRTLRALGSWQVQWKKHMHFGGLPIGVTNQNYVLSRMSQANRSQTIANRSFWLSWSNLPISG